MSNNPDLLEENAARSNIVSVKANLTRCKKKTSPEKGIVA
jgi:hypothetical protein